MNWDGGSLLRYDDTFTMRTLHLFSINEMSITETGKTAIMTIAGVQAVLALAPISGAGTTGGRLGLLHRPHLLSTDILFEKTIYIFVYWQTSMGGQL